MTRKVALDDGQTGKQPEAAVIGSLMFVSGIGQGATSG